MQLFNTVEIVLEDVSYYTPDGMSWQNHFRKFFQFQTWNDRTEQAWLLRVGKYRLHIVKEKPAAIAEVQKENAQQQQADDKLDKVA